MTCEEAMRTLKPKFAVRIAGVALCASLAALGVAAGLARGDGAAAPSTGSPQAGSTTSPQAGSPRATSGPAPAGDAEARLGIIRFIPLAGWQAVEQPDRDAGLFVSPDSSADRQAAIVVLLTQPLGQSFDFRHRFEKAVENAADAQPLIERGPVTAGTSRQGCDTLEQTFAYKNSAGQIVRGRLVAARIGDRLAAFWYLAAGEDLFKKHDDDLGKLLSTVRFEGLPATVPATAPATGPPASAPASKPAIDPELQAIERENAELRKRLAALESREKALHAPTTQPSPAAPRKSRR